MISIRNRLVSADCNGNIIFWDINDNFKMIKLIKKSQYCSENNNKVYMMSLFELKDQKILISTSSISTLTFFNLMNYEIMRNIKLNQGIVCLIGLENEEELIFNVTSEIVIWK